MSIFTAVHSRDRRKALQEIADKLAKAMDVAEPNMLPQLSGQLRTTLAELADLGGSGVAKRNELGERRAARIAGAASAAPAVKARGKRRA